MASILITGASRGIGFATALILSRKGHTVSATMRDPKGSPDLAQTAEKERLPITIHTMDVDSDASVRETIASMQNSRGPIDVLVNNAGVDGSGPVEELPISEFRRVMETNYFGALRCIQAVLPEMRKLRSGCIINVSSVGGRVVSPPMTPYAASKFALEALSEGLAQEAKMFNIRVAIVEPGVIDTDMPRKFSRKTGAASSPYPQTDRLTALFATSLENPTPPQVVGEKIREIIETGTWKLRHPVGPDAEGYLMWRASMTDEQWVELNAADDETWYGNVMRVFGIDVRAQAARKRQT
jgi:NAD(P)-dependent dehydrogenase (short-subunit alcohol dehydrogenase family)